MSLSSISLKRPVLAMVMSIIIVIFGGIGFGFLGVREYPSIDPPVITVRTSYTGASAEVVERVLTSLPKHLQAYVEIPVGRDPAELVAAISRHGARAKVRTGGVTPEAFPATADLVRFLRTCVGAGVPFKATAGLHHALRASYRLTYAPDSPRGTMFGFLNVFLAAAFLREGMDNADAARLLEEADPRAFGFDDGGIAWRGRRIEAAAIRAAREQAIVSFGSCSFTEPMDDLASLYLL